MVETAKGCFKIVVAWNNVKRKKEIEKGKRLGKEYKEIWVDKLHFLYPNFQSHNLCALRQLLYPPPPKEPKNQMVN